MGLILGLIEIGGLEIKDFMFYLDSITDKYTVSSRIEVLDKVDGIILYSFDDINFLLQYLSEKDLYVFLKEKILSGTPFLGIGSGMQLLFTDIISDQYYQGLNIIPGEVDLTKSNLSNQHEIDFQKPNKILNNIYGKYIFTDQVPYVTINNSEDVLVNRLDNKNHVVSILRNRILGLSFAPQKNSDIGITLIDRFIDLSML